MDKHAKKSLLDNQQERVGIHLQRCRGSLLIKGGGLSPKVALAAGLKVGMDVIPADVEAAIKA